MPKLTCTDEMIDVDAICDEAVRLTEQSEGGRPLWQAAYHGAMLTKIAMHSARPIPTGYEELAEKCAKACLSEAFPSTATFETRIERVLREHAILEGASDDQ